VEPQRRVIRKLKSKFGNDDTIALVRGVIVSVSGSTATVTMRGSNIPGVPFYDHIASLTAGDSVDILMVSGCPVIIGRP